MNGDPVRAFISAFVPGIWPSTAASVSYVAPLAHSMADSTARFEDDGPETPL